MYACVLFLSLFFFATNFCNASPDLLISIAYNVIILAAIDLHLPDP
jgi:hypothetical protein